MRGALSDDPQASRDRHRSLRHQTDLRHLCWTEPRESRHGACCPYLEHGRARRTASRTVGCGSRMAWCRRGFLADGRAGGVTPYEDQAASPLEAGDVESALVVVTLLPAGVGPEEQAVRIAAMTEITVTIYWAFFRLGGLLPARWRFVPVRVRRKRERVERSLRLQIDASTYRSQTILHWHSHTNYEHLVRLAEQARA